MATLAVIMTGVVNKTRVRAFDHHAVEAIEDTNYEAELEMSNE